MENENMVEELIRERDALKARCDELRCCLEMMTGENPDVYGFQEVLADVLFRTPEESLKIIESNAVMQAITEVEIEVNEGFACMSGDLFDYAEELAVAS